ncbi:thioredoxin domain-containing protein [Solihabitans fulvus]|uniref:Thioredoxin domain-containing protein n=1 Tax=Solihabitans fulvus TaxID=1892852 RepID=A0A5B2XIZ2_9PSEU|nr:thioredoxin domain-containing protein [Solihabitans fulvus]KAA2262851.1 thioredoxin domain-containing protein [Solihabitans fulvus]
MGGAERNARKKKQQSQAQAARAVAAARGTNADRNRMVIGAVVIVVLAAAVIGGVLISNSRSDSQASGSIPAKTVNVNYPVQRQDAVVVAGKDSAKVTVDVYEDFICPGCGAFEKNNADNIEKQLEAGTLKVRYNMLPMLNRMSSPPGYSQRAANAGLCAADASKFPQYHASLYAARPEEGSSGYTADQLVQLGKDLGITDSKFESCVRGNTYDPITTKHLEDTTGNPKLQQESGGQKGFFTPTVVSGDAIQDTSDPQWLDNLIKKAN